MRCARMPAGFTMADPASRSTEGQGLWSALRELLKLKPTHSLRASIEDAIEEHRGDSDDPDDLDKHERVMLSNLMKLSDVRAGEIAVPRADIIAVAEDCSFTELVSRFREAGHSRFPLYRGNLDEVVGMLHVKDVYAVIADQFGELPGEETPLPTLAELVRPVLAVPASKPVMDLLTDMRRDRTHMAIIVDEFGGTDGLVTIEDIVEEIVGDIEDEHDDEVVASVHRGADGVLDAGARVELDDLEQYMGLSFAIPEHGDDVDTLGGLTFLLAGRVPETGEYFAHPNGWTIEVTASDGRRVESLRLHPPVSPDSGAPPEA